jgi:hypothetical protein
MPKQVTLDTVRKLALELPRVEESTSYGAPAFKIGSKVLASVPTNQSAEPGSLMVRMNMDARDELIAAAPDIYYTKEHYQDYACVLVRLSRIKEDQLRDLLRGAVRFVSRQEKPTRRRGSPK